MSSNFVALLDVNIAPTVLSHEFPLTILYSLSFWKMLNNSLNIIKILFYFSWISWYMIFIFLPISWAGFNWKEKQLKNFIHIKCNITRSEHSSLFLKPGNLVTMVTFSRLKDRVKKHDLLCVMNNKCVNIQCKVNVVGYWIEWNAPLEILVSLYLE